MILEEIARKTRERMEEQKRRIPLAELKAQAADGCRETDFPFKKALGGEDIRFICEVKKASPSRGVIAEHFPHVEIAEEYEAAGAAALSVLTEPYYFQGQDCYLSEIRRSVKLPILRKDFTVDEYMIYQAKTLGADAVLLICSILSATQLMEYLQLSHALGLSALVEAHNESEIGMAVQAGAGIIGVNNRNLKDFTVDMDNSIRLRRQAPENIIFVAESGIRTPEDIARLRENGVDAVLIGETLMRSSDKKTMLEELAGMQAGN